jgi:hypothetical protein
MILGNSGFAGAGQGSQGGVAKLNSYSTNGVAPHSATQRWSYTVPTAKRADCNTSLEQIVRQTAAGAASNYYIFIDQTPNGGSTVQIASLQGISNTVGASVNSNGCIGAHGEAGDVFTGNTGDNSTTGTLMLTVQAGFIEYNV